MDVIFTQPIFKPKCSVGKLTNPVYLQQTLLDPMEQQS